MDKDKNIELTNEQLDDVTGGNARKDKDFDMVRCPKCGACNNVPAKAGRTITCSKCGAELEL